MNINLKKYERVDSSAPITLQDYDSGVCCISATCPDSLRLAKQLAQYSIEIIYVDDGRQHVLEGAGFRDTGKQIKVNEPDTFDYVPVLYLKKNNKYYGTWTTHHGNPILFDKGSKSVYNINGTKSKLKL